MERDSVDLPVESLLLGKDVVDITDEDVEEILGEELTDDSLLLGIGVEDVMEGVVVLTALSVVLGKMVVEVIEDSGVEVSVEDILPIEELTLGSKVVDVREVSEVPGYVERVLTFVVLVSGVEVEAVIDKVVEGPTDVDDLLTGESLALGLDVVDEVDVSVVERYVDVELSVDLIPLVVEAVFVTDDAVVE